MCVVSFSLTSDFNANDLFICIKQQLNKAIFREACYSQRKEKEGDVDENIKFHNDNIEQSLLHLEMI